MSTSPQVQNRGLVSRALPTRNPDSQGSDVAQRFETYGAPFVHSPIVGKYPWAEEGSCWRTGTPTLGTGVSSSINTSFSNTASALIYLNNLSTTKNVWIDYLKVIVTVAGASGTTWQYGCQLDTAPRTQSTVHMIQSPGPVCPNLGVSYSPAAAVFYQNSGTATALAAPSTQVINSAEGAIGGISIVGDEYVIEFGRENLAGTAGLTAAQATDPGRKVSSGPPQVVMPGGSWTFYFWGANIAITAMSYSFELCGRDV